MGNIRYQVGSGETLSGIARRHKVAADVLARLNGISDVNQIRAGQILEIPAEPPRPVVAAKRVLRHRVRAGETLSEIAQRYKVPLDVLARANGLADPDRIPFGLELEIPAAGQPSSSGAAKHSTPSPVPAPPPESSQSSAASRASGAQGAKKLPFDGSTQVGKIGRVSNPEGVNLRLTPDPKGAIEERIPFNMRVFVDRQLPGDWYFVTLEDGRFGYVYTKYVILDPPEPGAVLHLIKSGETALEIVRQHYKGGAISWGQDERYYVNVLVEANRSEKLCGIYKPSAKADWSETRTRANYFIWVPSVEFAKSLKEKVRSGSISYELWQTVKRAASVVADVLLGTAAFVAGLIHGALESLWDFVTGIFDLLQLLWQLLVSAIRWELHPSLKALWDVVSKLTVGQLIDAGVKAFLDKWNDKDLLRRWHFRGWLVGYAIAEIAMALLGGAAVLKWAGKTSRLGKLLQKIPGVVKTLDKMEDAWKSVPEPMKEKLRKVVALTRKKRLLEYEKLSEKIRKVYSKAEFEKIVTRAEKLKLKEKELLDFLEMAVISKPSKKPPKVPLTTEELIKQMDNWTQVIRRRGYPYLFDSLAQFKQFQTRLKKLLKKYGIPEGRMVVQGSALRTPNAKDIDIAIFVADDVFEAFVSRCEAGIIRRTKRRSTGLKIADEARQNASEGYISKFHFDRAPDAPDVSFEKELWQVMEDLFQKEVDISVMKSSSKMDLYPSMDM
jgi:LysM repeat protein